MSAGTFELTPSGSPPVYGLNTQPVPSSRKAEVDFSLHKKQGLALLSDATEIGYGGAAGGGKSHLGRVSSIYFSANIPGLQTYLFRRTSNELVKNHIEGPTGYPVMLAPWTRAGLVRIVKNEIRFWNGSKIFLCHCQYEKNVFSWLGPEMHYLIIEQAEQFTEFMIRMLRGRNRIPEVLNIPDQFKALFPRCLYTFNPGGVGHAYFKARFVKARPPMEIEKVSKEEGGKRRQFIPAKLEDNPSVNPVEYADTLSGLPPKMAKALRDGDFDVVIGAYFPEVDRAKHLIRPFKIPDYWPRFMSMDWGACGEGDPFAIGWFAVSDGTVAIRTSTGDVIRPPRGSLVCYRSYWGRGLPKVTVANDVAPEILRLEANDGHISYRVAGGDIDEKRGQGPTLMEIFRTARIHFRKADRRRPSGWQQTRERLVGETRDDIEVPLIYFFEEMADEVETIANLQHDLHDPNDCAPGDDHFADMVRYACMSRPYSRTAPKPPLPLEAKFPTPTIDELWAQREQMIRGRNGR